MDRRRSRTREDWQRGRKGESFYARALRRIARVVGEISGAYSPDDPMSAAKISAALDSYASTIHDWAEKTARRMVDDVVRRDKAQWYANARQMGLLLREEVMNAPTGVVARAVLDRQTELITSLPREAAERVRVLSREANIKGTRAKALSEEILKLGDITKARANLIARTEVSRTATELTKARAQSIGSTEFIWRTAGDSDVRPTHKALNGKTFRWDSPPECDPGYHALPGAIFNCRCYPEPVIPDQPSAG